MGILMISGRDQYFTQASPMVVCENLRILIKYAVIFSISAPVRAAASAIAVAVKPMLPISCMPVTALDLCLLTCPSAYTHECP